MKTLQMIYNLTNYDTSVVRRAIGQRLRCQPKGKGNKAWKRADATERAFRARGGFYWSDLIP